MGLRALFAAVGLLGLLGQVILFVILIVRRKYRSFPIFTSYIAFNLFYDIGLGALIVGNPNGFGRSLAFALLPVQYLIEIAVLLEIAWHVLRPVHVSLPKGSIRFFILSVIVAVIGGTLLAWHVDTTGNKLEDIKAPLDLTVGFLRLLVFVATAAFAQLLGINWKDKVLQLATALSFYSAASLILSLVERFAGNNMEPIRGFLFLLEVCSLVWVFTTKDAERREFSPQMEQFLITLAGRAKHARTVLVRMQVK
jgi:hypothetical protein